MSDQNHLDGTIYEKLSVGSIRFDTWLNIDEDEEIIRSTFRHPIVIAKYLILMLFVLLVGLVGATQHILILVISLPIIGIIGIYAMLERYKRYYILTNKQLIKKNGLFTDDASRKSANRIQNQSLTQSVFAKLVSSVSDNYGNIYIQTASGNAEPDVVLDHVPNPNKFTADLQGIQDTNNQNSTN